MNTVEYYTNSQTVIVYLDWSNTNKIDALNEAARAILKEVIRCEHGFSPNSDR